MTATMTSQAIFGTVGEIMTNGPVILLDIGQEIPVGHRLLWNELAYSEEGRERYGYFSTALRDIVTNMPARKITCMRAIRSLCKGVGYDMSLWEAKVTYEAVLHMVLRDARASITEGIRRGNASMVERNVALLRKHGEWDA